MISRERDLPEVHLLLEDEVEQEVEGPLEHRGADRVGHRVELPADRPPTGHPAALRQRTVGTSGHPCNLLRHDARVLGHPAHRRDPPRQLRRRGAALGGRPGEPRQTLYCVVDLHALTIPYDPDGVRRGHPPRRPCCCWPSGLDPERCTLFVQSHVARAHRADLDPQLHRHLRRAAAHDPVQGEVAKGRVR